MQKAALNGARFTETVHINLFFTRGKAFDRQNGFPLEAGELLHAGLYFFAVHEHRAGAAGTLAATVLGGGQTERVAQEREQGNVLFRLNRDSVYG